MSILLKIVYFNDIIVPIVAILLNILLLWLIKTTKTKNLIHINYSLVPNSFIDIFGAILTFIVAPHILQIEGSFYLVFGDLFGSLQILNRTTASFVTSFFSGFLIIGVISITVSFYLRYLIICKHQTINVKTMFLPYFTLFCIFITFYVLFIWFYLLSSDPTKTLNSTIILLEFWKEEYGRSPLFVTNEMFSATFFVNSGFILIVLTSAYSLIVYFSRQISKTLKDNIASNNFTTKLLHKQIQRALFFQAIGPFLIGSFPVLLILAKTFIAWKSIELSLILSLFFPWISITNPIAALIFIKPYQNRITSMLKFLLKPFQQQHKTSKILPAAK